MTDVRGIKIIIIMRKKERWTVRERDGGERENKTVKQKGKETLKRIK